MKINKNDDWYSKLKVEIIHLVILFKLLKEDVVLMLHTNSWILEDINLFESFCHLKEMIDVSNNDLDKFITSINILDSNSNIFYISDLKNEFEYIKENIYLESSYITNMINYMAIASLSSINDFEIVERLEQYQEIDISCYNQMKINNEELKRLKKERRD